MKEIHSGDKLLGEIAVLNSKAAKAKVPAHSRALGLKEQLAKAQDKYDRAKRFDCELSELSEAMRSAFWKAYDEVDKQYSAVEELSKTFKATIKRGPKSGFDVILQEFGANKIGVIIELRAAVAGLGLAEAKALVEGAPKLVREGVTKEEAEEIKGKLEMVGAKAEVK